MLTILTRKSKETYYTALFNENKSDIKQTWKEIKKIVNINKKCNDSPATIRDGGTTVTDKKRYC